MGGVSFGDKLINPIKIRFEGASQAGFERKVDGDGAIGTGFSQHSFPIRAFDEIDFDFLSFDLIDEGIGKINREFHCVIAP
jgi:hypothetical protein